MNNQVECENCGNILEDRIIAGEDLSDDTCPSCNNIGDMVLIKRHVAVRNCASCNRNYRKSQMFKSWMGLYECDDCAMNRHKGWIKTLLENKEK
jgi:hypothetical protein